ncbi:MAG: hypothetical protein AAGN46_07100, partial [Acidobacteriota bacterium]
MLLSLRVLSVCLAIALCSVPLAAATPCELGDGPAATLLLPYFEVDLADPDGVTTLMSINNAQAEPTVAHVTLWTDYGVPTVDFHLYLTGFDVVTLNLRDVFIGGDLPITADAGTDPDDEISPSPLDAWDAPIESCSNFFPYSVSVIPGPLLQRLSDGHTGQPSAFDDGLCLGHDHGDEVARGYVTVDNVNRCELAFPSDAGYFADGGSGVASNVNQLWGDYYLVEPGDAFAQGDTLVHIEAFDGVGEGGAWQEGNATFYASLVDDSAVDNREPLPNAFAARFVDVDGFDSETSFLVWRGTPGPVEPVECVPGPSWYPQLHGQVVAFDEQETPADLCIGCPVCSPPIPARTCLPLATQRVGLGTLAQLFAAPFDSGWVLFNLDAEATVGRHECGDPSLTR